MDKNKTVTHIKKNLFYVLLANPKIYLKVLLYRTLGIGLFTLIMSLTINFLGLNMYTIPASMHSLIGIVIGLLLVFRTNTAYDRWWEGRKLISLIAHQIDMLSALINVMQKSNELEYENLENLRKEFSNFLILLRNYLNSGEDGESSTEFHIQQRKLIQKALFLISKIDKTDINVNNLTNSLDKLVEYSNGLERIKNTPIPLSYVFHIKISIYIYLFSLPFGVFHDLNIFAVPLIMLIYYIIAGVEIISNEIENPFANDPNDIPTIKLFNVILKTLNKHGDV